MTNKYLELELKANWVRQKVLEMAVYAHSGHVSTACSQTELLVALYYGGILSHDPKNPKWEKRDRFILSKGQGGIGLFPILADLGYFPLAEIENFAGKGSLLGVHTEWHIPGIEVTSGSLGHGLPIATGISQAGIIDKKSWLVFCFLGDSELFEGSNWEAAFFAGSHKQSNLVCIVDRNKQGVMGFTDRIDRKRDGPILDPVDEKFKAFGFETRVIKNGHSFEEIFSAFKDIRDRKEKKPLAIIANTIKGKDISVMEKDRFWHYRVPAGEDLESAWKDLKQKQESLEKSRKEQPIWQTQNS